MVLTSKEQYTQQLIDAVRAGDALNGLVYLADLSYNSYQVVHEAIEANSHDGVYHLMGRLRYNPLNWDALLDAAAFKDPSLVNMILIHQSRHEEYQKADVLLTQYLAQNNDIGVRNILTACNPLRIIERAEELLEYSQQVKSIVASVQRAHERDFTQVLYSCSFEQFVDYLRDPDNQRMLQNFNYEDHSALSVVVLRVGAHVQWVKEFLNVVPCDFGSQGLQKAIAQNHRSTIDCLLRHQPIDANFDQCFLSALQPNNLPFDIVHKIVHKVSNTAFVCGINTMFLEYIHAPHLVEFERNFIDLLDARFEYYPFEEFEQTCNDICDPTVKQWVLKCLTQTAHHQKSLLLQEIEPTLCARNDIKNTRNRVEGRGKQNSTYRKI